MVVNGKSLIEAMPIRNMLTEKHKLNGVSHGLAEVGYDIRIKQDVMFAPQQPDYTSCLHWVGEPGKHTPVFPATTGRFCIASAMEEFDMPNDLMGVVHDKSTWARQGLSVFNTILEPGWNGYLTLELVYHGNQVLRIPAGSGIAQVIFHRIAQPAAYVGKYQSQADMPVPAVFE